MRADDWPTPTRIIGELLTSHLEAESLLAEAGHRQALAAWSAADTGTRFRGAQAARRAYEELWHRLEPRRRRWALLSGIVAAAMALEVLLVALHAFAPHQGWPTAGDRSRGDPVAMSTKTTRADPRQGVLPIDADLRQYCLRNLPSSELQIPLSLCHPLVAIRWAASRILATGR